MWVLYHQRIKTSMRLYRLGIITDPKCKVCGHHMEDITHIFFTCYIAKNFWR